MSDVLTLFSIPQRGSEHPILSSDVSACRYEDGEANRSIREEHGANKR